MTDTDQFFARELEIFRTEVEAAAQFHYAGLAIHTTAAQHSEVVSY
jgi:hypothetical protein